MIICFSDTKNMTLTNQFSFSPPPGYELFAKSSLVDVWISGFSLLSNLVSTIN